MNKFDGSASVTKPMALFFGFMLSMEAIGRPKLSSFKFTMQIQHVPSDPSDGYSFISVDCSDLNCTWTSVAIGQCLGGAFFPKVERFSSDTDWGMLTSTRSGDTWHFSLDFGSERQTYSMQTKCDKLGICKIESFSGRATLPRDGKIKTIEIRRIEPNINLELACSKVATQ